MGQECLWSLTKVILLFSIMYRIYLVLSVGSDDKEYACNTGDLGPIPGLEKFPGEGNFLEWESQPQYV